MGLSNKLSCEAENFSCCCHNPHRCFNQWFEALCPLAGALGCTVCFAPPLFLPVYLCVNVGPQGLPTTILWGLLAAAWPALSTIHHLAGSTSSHLAASPLCPGCPSPSLLPVWMNVSSLSACFVGLPPYSSIFCQFWLFFVFKLLFSFFWLCEEAQCVYLHLHLVDRTIAYPCK